MNKSIDEKQKQILLLNNVIDQLVNRLHQEVEDLKVRAKELIKSKASEIWEKSPITSIQQVAEATLANIREVRESLEYEIQRFEKDELAIAERSKEMDAFSDQFAAFLQSKIQLPALSLCNRPNGSAHSVTGVDRANGARSVALERGIRSKARISCAVPKSGRSAARRVTGSAGAETRASVRPEKNP